MKKTRKCVVCNIAVPPGYKVEEHYDFCSPALRGLVRAARAIIPHLIADRGQDCAECAPLIRAAARFKKERKT